MKKEIIDSLLIIIAIFSSLPATCQINNILSNKEKKEDWKLLFNGKNFDGRRLCNSKEMTENWSIEFYERGYGG